MPPALDAAPGSVETPRVVVLSPGSASDIGFDTSFLATMLGFDVVEADDLVTSRGRPGLRAGDRLEPVDVVLRRVEAAMSDPLEFRGNSEIGLPGLIEAARNGHVGIANPVGAGVLDNPALIAHLDGVAEALLGETLLLRSPQTWWCGEPAGLSHVRANLARLVLKPIDRDSGGMRYGWQLNAAERDELAARIAAEPWAWCGQEPLELSTAPVVTGTGLEPRRFVLRGFGVASGAGFQFLPGGLGRVAGSTREFSVSHRAGTLAKDVWVPSAALADDLAPARPRLAVVAAAHPVRVTPRAARTLLAIGRHAERAESTARLLKVIDNLVEDNLNRADTPGHTAMTAMLGALWEVTAARPEPVAPGDAALLDDPLPSLRALLVDSERRGCVAYNAARLTYAASDVREMLSFDTFGVLNRLAGTLAAAAEAGDEVEVQEVCAHVMEACLALAGMTHESLMRDPVWAFLEAGQRLERAQLMVRLLRHTVAVVRPPIVEAIVTEAVLRVGDSLITYRRRMAAGVGSNVPAAATVQLLLTDDTNPRSVVFSLGRTLEAVLLVPDRAVEDVLVGVLDLLRGCDEEALCRGDRSRLVALLDGLDEGLRAAADAVSAAHFDAQQPSVSFAVPELAGPGEEAW